MKIIKMPDYNGMSRQAANILSAQVIMKPDSVLGLATGSTPIGVYRQLVEWYKKGDIDFSQVRTVNLDEYCGLAPDHEQSYAHFMWEHLFSQINIKKENVHLPNGLEPDEKKECARYNALLEKLGFIDLQLLGIGHNGHIGFNEPGHAFALETHRVKLTESTLQANSRLFDSIADMPRYAYSMGIKSIMQARRILVIVSGADKADIVKQAFTGEVSPAVPASVLQLHPGVTLVGDEAALAKL